MLPQGPPFEFKFVSTLRLPVAVEAHPKTDAHPKAEADDAAGGMSAEPELEPRSSTPDMRLRRAFNAQW